MRLVSRRSTVNVDGRFSLLRETLVLMSAGFVRARSEPGMAPPSPSPFESAPVMALNGRPEAAVTIVDTWTFHGSWASPENTNRWRWSCVAGPRSASGSNPTGRPSWSFGSRPRPLSCGMNALWKSVELSSALPSVYDARNSTPWLIRLLSDTVRPLYQVSPKSVYCRIDADVPATPLRSLGRRLAPSDGTTGL